MSGYRPSFYARTGTATGDLIALLHPPYTAWHLAYVALGAALAPQLDSLRLAGTLAAFFLGTGVAAHALDEWHDRPLRTGLSDGVLLGLAAGALAAVMGIAIAGSYVISPWLLAWAVAGLLLALAYSLNWSARLHSDLGFALAWGAFPVVVGYWVQAETFHPAPLVLALAATLLSLAQRALSTPARFVRRTATDVAVSFALSEGRETWARERLLNSWERPLQLLAAAVATLAVGLLATHT